MAKSASSSDVSPALVRAGTTGTVDLHAHIFPDTVPPVRGPDIWPTLNTGAGVGQIMLGSTVFRKVAPTLWSLPERVEHMNAHGVAIQLVSPVPITLTYGHSPGPAAAFMRSMNEAIAEQVHSSGGRLIGLGTVPLQDTDLAIAELEYVVKDLGLAGAEIGTVIGQRELDDPTLRDFFAAAADLGARLFVHPMDGGQGVIRRASQPYSFGLGMLTDTALAAGALVFGGVLDEHPHLPVLLSHGGGSFAWAYPRLRLMAALSEDRDFDSLVRKLFVDCLVFDPAHLGLLLHRFGHDQLVAGTDFPFFPQQEQANATMLSDAVHAHHLPADVVGSLTRDNGLRFLGH